MATELASDLESLHTRAIDARHGYEEALEQAEGKGLTPLFRKMIALHGTNAAELEAELARLGRNTDRDGSFMSTVHRTIMDIRSLFGGLDASVLPGLIDGEQRNLERYDEVLRDPDIDPPARERLAAQRERLAEAIATMHTLNG